MYLPRRHANPKFSEGWSYERCITNAPPAGKSEVHCEYGEIYSILFTRNGIPRYSGQLHSHELFPPGKQSPKPLERLQETKFKDCLTVRSSTLNWQNDSSKDSCFPGSTSLQGISTPEELLTPPGSSLHQKVILDIEAILDLEQWVTKPGHSELQTSEASPSRPANPVGCFRVRLGAVCKRIDTRRNWSLYESSLHINCLELNAATYAIKAFTKSLSNAHVLIQMDNTSAIANVNKMGEAKQGVIDKHARSLWEWCLVRNITL